MSIRVMTLKKIKSISFLQNIKKHIQLTKINIKTSTFLLQVIVKRVRVIYGNILQRKQWNSPYSFLA